MKEKLYVPNFAKPSLGDDCECGRGKTSVWWTCCGLCAAHGMESAICELCSLEKQLKAAKESAARIPELEKRLEELNDKNYAA